MSINYRIAQATDLENIYNYSYTRLQKQYPNEMELMMKVWESRFRKEALQHYLQLGWSFIAEEAVSSEIDSNQKICGFFIGQPFLFFEGQTQTLWVELLQASNTEIENNLLEIAVKLSKDKHFQKVYFSMEHQKGLNQLNIKFNDYSEKIIWCKTTK